MNTRFDRYASVAILLSIAAPIHAAPRAVQIAAGEIKTADFQSPAPQAPKTIQGTVVGPDGAPIANADVLIQNQGPNQPSIKTDAHGHFLIEQIFLGPDLHLFARAGALGTTQAITPASDAPITLRLEKNAFCIFQGKVNDQDGKPMAHARMSLIRWVKNGGGAFVETMTTDASGRYAFAPNYSGCEYSVQGELPGYASANSAQTLAAPGKTLDMPALILTKADSFAGGVVLDPKGNPVAGAKIQAYSIPGLEAITNKNGRFHLSGVPRDNTVVGVNAPENRQASVQITSGRDDNEITVHSDAEQEEESKRFVAAVNADATNHGDGSDAHALLKAAQDKASPAGKSVLLVFHASWCGPCFLLHRFLEDPKIKPILDKYFVVQDLDIWEKGDKTKWENPGGTDIYKQYGGPNSVPFYAVLDPAGKKLGDSIHHGENMGMPSQPADTQFFLDTLKQAQPSLTSSEVEALKAGLKAHASL